MKINYALYISDVYDSSRYLREVPVSVLPPHPQSNMTNVGSNLGNRNSELENSAILTNSVKPDTTTTETAETNVNPVEFFISSDGSAILEHTNRVIYLEVIYFI